MITLKHDKQIKQLFVLSGCNLVMTVALAYQGHQIMKELKEMPKKDVKNIVMQEGSSYFDLTSAVIAVESSGNPNAYNSRTGAVGLMQLTPIVYKDICGLTKKEAFEPTKNVACGKLFLNSLVLKYKGNHERALTHYNGGYKLKSNKYARKVLDQLNQRKKRS